MNMVAEIGAAGFPIIKIEESAEVKRIVGSTEINAVIASRNRVNAIIDAGFEAAERHIGLEANITIIEGVIWPDDMGYFLDYIDDMKRHDGTDVAICDSGTNFVEIVIALTERHWVNERVICLDYGKRAVVFTRQEEMQ